MRSPGYAYLVNWISEIWESMDTNLIAKSFDVCGITSNGESLSSILKTVLSSNESITDYVVDQCVSEEFELNDNDLFDVEMLPEAAVINPSEVQSPTSVPYSSKCCKCYRTHTSRCRAWILCDTCHRSFCSLHKPKSGVCC
jgi:hypothetical protein